MGFVVGPQPPQVLHRQGGELAAHISAVDFRQRQRAVGQQGHGVKPGQAQLRERGNLNRYLPVGALQHIGNEIGVHVLAPEQRPVDAGVLQGNIFALRNQFRRVGQAGLFRQGSVVVGLENPLDILDRVQGNVAVIVAQGNGEVFAEFGLSPFRNRRANQGFEVAVADVDGAGAAGVFGGVGFQRIADFPHHRVAVFLVVFFFHHRRRLFLHHGGGGHGGSGGRHGGSGRGRRGRRHCGGRLPARHQQGHHQHDGE